MAIRIIPPPRVHGTTTTTPHPLYWARYGPSTGAPLMVLHGGPGAHHDYLLPQLLALCTDRELVFYDQRGGGRSRTPDQTPIGWQDQVADLGLVAQELSCLPLTLVGYSWGALLAMLYCLEAPRLGAPPPHRLVLIDPAPVNRRHRATFEAEFARRQQDPRLLRLRDELAASGLRERDPDAYKQRTFELSVAAYFADPLRASDLTPFRVTGRVQQSTWDSLGDFDLLPQLESVRVPTLIVHGWQDPIPVDSSIAAARAMRARLVVLESSGHVPYVEQPDALFATIEQFLRDTDARGG